MAEMLKTIRYASSLAPHIKVAQVRCFLRGWRLKDRNWAVQAAVKKLDMGRIWSKKKKKKESQIWVAFACCTCLKLFPPNSSA